MSSDLNALLLRYGQFWQQAMIVRVPAEAECWLFEREAEAYRAFRADLPWWRRIFVERTLPHNIREMNNADLLNCAFFSTVLRRFIAETELTAYNLVLKQKVPAYLLGEWTGDAVIGEVAIRALKERLRDINSEEQVKRPLTFQAVHPGMMRNYIVKAYDENFAASQIGVLDDDLPAELVLEPPDENILAMHQSDGPTPSFESSDLTTGLVLGTLPDPALDDLVSSHEQVEVSLITLDRFTHDGHLVEIDLDLVGSTFRIAPHSAGLGFAATIACFMDNRDGWTLQQAAKSPAIRKLAAGVRRDVVTGRYVIH